MMTKPIIFRTSCEPPPTITCTSKSVHCTTRYIELGGIFIGSTTTDPAQTTSAQARSVHSIQSNYALSTHNKSKRSRNRRRGHGDGKETDKDEGKAKEDEPQGEGKVMDGPVQRNQAQH